MEKISIEDLGNLFRSRLAQVTELQDEGVDEPQILIDTITILREARRVPDLSTDQAEQLDQWIRALAPSSEDLLARYMDSKT